LALALIIISKWFTKKWVAVMILLFCFYSTINEIIREFIYCEDLNDPLIEQCEKTKAIIGIIFCGLAYIV